MHCVVRLREYLRKSTISGFFFLIASRTESAFKKFSAGARACARRIAARMLRVGMRAQRACAHLKNNLNTDNLHMRTRMLPPIPRWTPSSLPVAVPHAAAKPEPCEEHFVTLCNISFLPYFRPKSEVCEQTI